MFPELDDPGYGDCLSRPGPGDEWDSRGLKWACRKPGQGNMHIVLKIPGTGDEHDGAAAARWNGVKSVMCLRDQVAIP